MQQDDKQVFSKGKLIVPDIELKVLQVEIPAIERFAKKGSFIFTIPPFDVKKPTSLTVKVRKMDSFAGLVYFYPHTKKIQEVDIPKNSADAVILNLNGEKLLIHFFEKGRLSTFQLEITPTSDQLVQLKALPSTPRKIVDLQKNEVLLKPIIWEALKQGKRLNSSCFGHDLGALKSGPKYVPIRYACTEKTEVVARLYSRDPVSGVEIYETRVVARNYTKKDSQRPEETEESDTLAPGFMFGTDLEAPHKVLAPSPDALFTTQPRIDQTRQGSFGNCFLLAAIKCIALTNANFIIEMMKQGDQGITVRLYQEILEGKLIPVFKLVPNAIIHKKTRDGFFSSRPEPISAHEGGLWLHALENAYATLDKSICPSFLGKYGHGGLTKSAFEALTGNPASEYSLKEKKFPKFGEIQTLILHKIFSAEEKESGSYKSAFEEILNEDSLLYYLFDKKEEDMVLFVKELQKLTFSGSSFAAQFNGLIFDFDSKEIQNQEAFAKSLQSLCKEISSLLKLIKDSPAHDILKKALDLSRPRTSTTRTYKEFKYEMLAGPELSGQYTLQQVQTYEHIKTSLKAGKLVAAATMAEVGMPPGLASRHAYAVVGCQNIQGRLYIRMQNPWGRHGLKYGDSKDSLRRIQIDSEVSTVELGDFFRFFDAYQVGTLPRVPSLGLKNSTNLDQQIKSNELRRISSSLEAGFITYDLLSTESKEEHKENEPLTDVQKLFLAQELDSYTAAFTKYIQQRIKVFESIYSFRQYTDSKEDGPLHTELAKLMDPKLNLDINSSAIVGYLFYTSQLTDLQDYIVEIVNLIRQTRELQNNFLLLKADTRLIATRQHAAAYLNALKKITESVEEITYLGGQLNNTHTFSGPHIFSQSSRTCRQSASLALPSLDLEKTSQC